MRLRLLTLPLLLVCAGGCLNGADNVTRTIVPGALDSTVGYLEQPINQKRIASIMESPEIQKAIGDMVGGILASSVDTMTDDERMARVRDMSGKYVGSLSKAIADSLDKDLGPAAAASAEKLVAGVLASALSPKTRHDAGLMVDTVTRRLITALTESGAEGLRDDLGPAIAKVLQEDLGPALEHTMRTNIGPAVDDLLCDVMPSVNDATRGLTKSALLGVSDALDDAEFQAAMGRFSDAMLERTNKTLNKGIAVSTIVAIALAVLAVILALLITRAFLVRRRIERERAHSERMLLLIVQAMNTHKDKPEIVAMLKELHERESDIDDEGFLADLTARVGRDRRTAAVRR